MNPRRSSKAVLGLQVDEECCTSMLQVAAGGGGIRDSPTLIFSKPY